MEPLIELTKVFGAPVALLLGGIWALATEKVVPGAAYHRHVRDCNAHIRRLQLRIDRLEGFTDETLSLGEEAAQLLPVARARGRRTQ